MKELISFFSVKRLLCIVWIILLNDNPAFSQQGQWTWMKGDSTTNMPWNYGILGVPNPANLPLCTYEGSNWTDTQGRFWLFGGLCNVGGNNTKNLCDMWMFDPATNNWTWMKGNMAWNANGIYGTQGISAPANNPGSRGWGCATWTDLSGNLWLFGGNGYPLSGTSGSLSDLWKFDITSNEWTWVNGPSYRASSGTYGTLNVASSANHPPSRFECNATWVDGTGNLWMYGGLHIDSTNLYTALGDLWMYNISTDQWTWKGGSNTPNSMPSYGTKGVASSGNTPGARLIYAKWKDEQGNFWLFGGKRQNVGQSYNDLWKYDIITGEWTWVSGTNALDNPGNYVQRCVADTGYYPSARVETRSCWTDACNNFWLFAGSKNPNADFNTNDLWFYNPSTNQWTWVNGPFGYNNPGHYGVQTISSPLNQPQKRMGADAWMDQSGNLWMFGGLANITGSNWYFLNDMWRFVPDSACTGPIAGNGSVHVSPSSVVLCAGDSVLLTASGGNSYSWSPTVGLSSSTGQSVWASPSVATTYSVISTGSLCHNTAIVTINITSAPILTVSPNITICRGDTVTLNAGGLNSYTWSPAAGLDTTSGNSVQANPQITTTFTVTGNSNCGQLTNSVIVTVDSVLILSVTGNQSVCLGDSVLLSASGGNNYTWTPSSGLNTTSGCCVEASPSSSVIYTVSSSNICGNFSSSGTVNILPLPVLSVSGDTSICIGDSISLWVNGASAYSWIPNSTLNNASGNNVVAFPQAATTYTVTGTDANGCENNGLITVDVQPLPQLFVTPDVEVCLGDEIVLSASGANLYSWNPSTWLNTASGNSVTATPQGNIVYVVTGTSAFNCLAKDSVAVIIEDCQLYYSAPNVFTPNNDGSNDFFVIMAEGAVKYHICIYDRWGQLMFESNDAHNSWNGTAGINNKPASDGTYYYVVEINDHRNKTTTYTGFFELVR